MTASCALLSDDTVIAESFLNAKITHSATLMPMVESLFKNCGKKFDDVSMLAATTGPGSFTGVRIGCSIILGLAFGRDIPCVGVSTLEVSASPFDSLLYKDKLICPVMDARRGQFYNALFRNGERLTADRAISASDLSKELLEYGGEAIVCGDGYKIARELMSDVSQPDLPDSLIYPSAAAAARLAYKTFIGSQDKSIYSDRNFKPVYLRPSQAEVNYKKNKENI